MDEYSTPVSQLRPDMNEQQTVNYSDMLQSMEQTSQSAPEQHQSQNYPPPPIVQSRNNIPPNHHQIHNQMMMDTSPSQESKEDKSFSNFQKEAMYILIPSIILYSTQIQNYLLQTVPSLFKDDKPTIIGNIINAGIIALIFYTLKNMKVNFS